MDDNKFLGAGMKFPPAINLSTGRFQISSAQTSVKESVYMILMTSRGERWLLPSFGSRLLSYTFMDTSITMLSILANELRATLLEQEPRIADVTVDIDSGSREGCLVINIGYRIIVSNRQDNLVFPFYLNAGHEERDGYEGI